MLGTTVAAAGLGSAAYHGRGGRLAHWTHDATLLAALAFLPVENARSMQGRPVPTSLRAYAATVGANGTLLAVRPEATGALTACWGASAALTEAARRRAQPRSTAAADALLLAGLMAYLAGRTDSPLCRPESRLQLHGLWHLLSGAAVAAWARGALRHG